MRVLAGNSRDEWLHLEIEASELRFPRYVDPMTISTLPQLSKSLGGSTGCGSCGPSGLLPTVLEDIWEGELDRMEEGVLEKLFEDV